jgi:hypothetical protein
MRRVPRWLKVAWTLWLLLWTPVYWHQYGPANFLWFCDLGNFLIAWALWRESRLVFSWQAVSLLLLQILYCVDLLGRFFSGRNWLGATGYMFDPAIPPFVRWFALFHLVVPAVLLWAIRRLGYDSRGYILQVLTAWVVLPISYCLPASIDINWVRGLFYRQQHVVPPLLYLAGCMAAYPLLIYLPTHWVLRWWSGGGRDTEKKG